jgi:lipopolysaccharide export system protein LptA
MNHRAARPNRREDFRFATLARPTLAAALALGAAQAAFAQIAPSAKGPVDVTADQLEVKNGLCLASWRGDAEALQDTSRLRADVLNIYNKVVSKPATDGGNGQGCGVLDRMEADGSVYYVTPTQVVKGDHALYTADNKTIVVTGDVIATRGQDVIAGTRLVINTDTGVATMTSNVTGPGKPGRVRAIFNPNTPEASAETGPASRSNLRAPKPPPPRQHPAP